MHLIESDRHELIETVGLLENPGIAVKISNVVGMPIEKGLEMLPKNWSIKINDVTKSALLKAIDVAVNTLENKPKKGPANWFHKGAVATSGALGGFFGLGALAIELPVTTTLMLRSIADIAHNQGEDIRDMPTKLACLEVFALGGNSESDNAAESGYFAVRAAMAKSVAEAAEFVAVTQIGKESAPVLVRFITRIAERFSIPVSQKVAAQAIPLVGAAGGALVNTLFMDHFQDMAKGHFIVRKLERKYDKDFIRELYEEIRRSEESN